MLKMFVHSSITFAVLLTISLEVQTSVWLDFVSGMLFCLPILYSVGRTRNDLRALSFNLSCCCLGEKSTETQERSSSLEFS